MPQDGLPLRRGGRGRLRPLGALPPFRHRRAHRGPGPHARGGSSRSPSACSSPCGTWEWTWATGCAASRSACPWRPGTTRSWPPCWTRASWPENTRSSPSSSARLKRKLLPGREKGFKSWLEAQNERRRLVYGDASGRLEPDLKEGLGGLRDIHQVRWLADMTRGQARELLEPELPQLAENLDFLLLVRNHLHLATNRKTDRASLEAQRDLADRLGFTGRAGHPAGGGLPGQAAAGHGRDPGPAPRGLVHPGPGIHPLAGPGGLHGRFGPAHSLGPGVLPRTSTCPSLPGPSWTSSARPCTWGRPCPWRPGGP